MKISKIAMLAAVVCGTHFGTASAQELNTSYGSAVAPVGCFESTGCDCGEPACGCEVAGSCDTACEPACGCEVAGCEAAGCDGGCGDGCDSMCGLGGLAGCGDCDLGDPYSLFGEHHGINVGGWLQLGYHSKSGANRFNDNADGVRLHQAWLYAEKVADGSNGLDIGGRIDYVYGIDAPDTQAFGPADDSWDQDWDNGGFYGHALPQLYAEAAYGDLSVKAGHFYTIIGYEVVTAPDNFFYSHAYTMYNNEPFTHTGFLASYAASDALTLFGGYTFGWDSGFEDNGDNFLGGFSVGLTDDVTFTYATTIGRLGTNADPGTAPGLVEQGYMHSMVLDAALSDNLQWVFQYDQINTEESTTGTGIRDGFALVNYLIYNINDCTSVGSRFEYFHRNVDPALGGDTNIDVYDLTFGVNHRLHSNLIVRPEVRWDWDKNGDFGVNENNASSQATFGMDAILTF